MTNESLHTELEVKKGDFFVKAQLPNCKIGQILQGVFRGFVSDAEGEEVTTHFFTEGDLVSGNYIPNASATINIQALEDCRVSVANYKDVFLQVNTNDELTNIVLSNFQKLNRQNQSRLEALLAGDALQRYKWFLKEYPNLLNRIPHYHIANFLGMTPTQLSRTRKAFYQQM